ncbi:MAG: radical SAM protein [Candidatus Bathyarchaeota archaeon B63]|nr:MAG: radical SAM protein [Candidatus Bathyarchaeota archaeon B63]
MVVVPELNVVKKDWRRVDVKVALCYPNVYRAGMTGLTVKLLYALLNARRDVLCERFFIPTLREGWRSLESNQPLSRFDVAAFTLQYEEDYPNVIRMMLKSGVPPRREDRGEDDPLVIAGGPCATGNPEPLADYVDLFVIGEAEPVIGRIIDWVRSSGKPRRGIEELADLRGVYVPGVSDSAERVWVRSLDEAPHPLAQQIPLVDDGSPYMPVFGRAFTVEAVRGCGRSCRFCLIGHIWRPKRERSLEKMLSIIDEGLKYTPVRKVSVIGASLFDYRHLEELCEFIVSRGLEISVSSLSPEIITERLADSLVKGGQRTVTVAPDAATPRMRSAIGKMIEEEALKDAARTLLSRGIKQLKIYFMIGLPGETPEDVVEIADLSKRVADLGYGYRSVHLSINPLIPKPHTPFQRMKIPAVSYLRDSMRLIKKRLRGDRRFVIDTLDPRHAQIQTLLSLGDREVGRAIEFVARHCGGLGCWRRALKECGIRLEKYIGGMDPEAPLPWDKIRIHP